VVDGLLALAVLAIGLPAVVHREPRPAEWVLTGALVLPLGWRRRAPVAVFLVLAAVALVQWALGLRLTADVALLVGLYSVAAHRPRPAALAAAAVLEAGAVLAAVRFSPARDLLTSLVFLTGLVVAAFSIGTTVRNRRAYLGALVERAAWLERERDQQARLAATAERSRIAREMHDVVAHSLTVVVTLAEAAAVTAEADPPAAREAMGQVARTGRTALAEMRRLLGVLRAEPDDGDARAPVPGLHRLDELVDDARAAGLPVRLTVSGAARPLPTPVDVTAYRLVQESLTNSLRHAVDPTGVRVVLRWRDDALLVEVSDDGRPGAPAGAGGHGLAGMRERLALFGGSLTSGPGPAGGWTVSAVLPLPEEAA
jgi:signal transduction histidine kinase